VKSTDTAPRVGYQRQSYDRNDNLIHKLLRSVEDSAELLIELEVTLIGHRSAQIHTDLFSRGVEYASLDPSFRATMKYTPTLTVSRHSILIHLFQKAITTPIINPTEDCHTLLSQACVFPILQICVHPVGYFHIQRGSSVSCSKRKFLHDQDSNSHCDIIVFSGCLYSGRVSLILRSISSNIPVAFVLSGFNSRDFL